MNWVQFLAGLFVGAGLGFIACALFVVGGRSGEMAEHWQATAERRRKLETLHELLDEVDHEETRALLTGKPTPNITPRRERLERMIAEGEAES